MSNSSVVVDASVLIKVCIAEEFSEKALIIQRHWAESATTQFAPSLIDYELVSALSKKAFNGELSLALAEEALEMALGHPVQVVDTVDLHKSALSLAQSLSLRSTYDAYYLALAGELNCEFWTADERLYNAIRDRFPLIRWLGSA